MKYIKHHWPIFIIGGVIVLLAIINYRPGMILTGGDNLHPEFDFLLNIRRSFFASWQEYEGLGVLGAMGHASDLVRQLILWGMSTIVPIELLRYAWTMLTLFIGATGAYYLIQKVLDQTVIPGLTRNPEHNGIPHQVRDDNKSSSLNHQSLTINHSLLALLGSLFYLLNLATIQQYYTPFEVFTSHFAVLPWLFLTTILFFEKPNRKHTLLLIATLLIATPQGYVPTLFVVWLMATTILVLFLSHKNKSEYQSTKHETNSNDQNLKITNVLHIRILKLFRISNFGFRISRILKFYLLVFVVNAFWLLPFAYFVMTNVHVDVNAKINQMASDNIYLLNKEFGHLPDVMLLRGFWFDNIEPDRAGNITYMFTPWRDHFAHPFVQAHGYGVFTLVVIGVITAVRSRKTLLLAFTAILALALIMLTTATPPFEQINALLREMVPLFKEVFRFPFTKFSLLAGLMYAIFFTIGIQSVISFLKNRLVIASETKQSHAFSKIAAPFGLAMTKEKVIATLCSLLFALFLFTLSYPAFKGYLFYDRERVHMPREYTDLFSYLRTQDQSKRIALFPAHTFWDWKFYEWGYSGSGFLWYGVRQPILDRAFDMWGQHNENFYSELSQALYAENPDSLNRVFQKYDVSYLLVDTNVSYPSAPQVLFYPELAELLDSLPTVKKEKTFGDKITLYAVTLADRPENFVSLRKNLPSVNPYEWTNHDQAYADNGTYITNGQFHIRNSKLEIRNLYYPFRSLFSLKTQEDQEFTITEQESSIVLSQKIPPLQSGTKLFVPSYAKEQSVIPALVKLTKMPNQSVRIDLVLAFPEIWYGTQKVTGGEILQQIAVFPAGSIPKELTVNVNGVTKLPLHIDNNTEESIFLSLREDNVLVLTDSNRRALRSVTIQPASLRALSLMQEKFYNVSPSRSEVVFRVVIPKIEDEHLSFVIDGSDVEEVENCDIFKKGDASSVVTTNNGLGQIQVQAKNTTACTAFYSPDLLHNEAYAIFIDSEHVTGKSFHFWMVNEDTKFAPIDTYLPDTITRGTASFILPPQDTFGKGYSFHLDSIAIGDGETENIFHELSMYQIPYNFVSQLVLTTNAALQKNQDHSVSVPISVLHPNESLYVVNPTKAIPPDTTLVLSQSYDPGWHAYTLAKGKEDSAKGFCIAFPFFCGEEVNQHVMINNWANGWILDNSMPSALSSKQIVIVYLPQYLQYFGFLLLAGVGIYGVFTALRRPKHT